jgi:hypothetical protein
VVHWVWDQIGPIAGWDFAEFDEVVEMHEHLELDRRVAVHVAIYEVAQLPEGLLLLMGPDWLVLGVRLARSGRTYAYGDLAAAQASVEILSAPGQIADLVQRAVLGFVAGT